MPTTIITKPRNHIVNGILMREHYVDMQAKSCHKHEHSLGDIWMKG